MHSNFTFAFFNSFLLYKYPKKNQSILITQTIEMLSSVGIGK